MSIIDARRDQMFPVLDPAVIERLRAEQAQILR
jgi:hypothetical protein